MAGSRERYIYSKQNVEFRGSESSSGGESPRIRQQQKRSQRSRLLLFFIYYILSGTHDGERHPKAPPPLARMQEDTPSLGFAVPHQSHMGHSSILSYLAT